MELIQIVITFVSTILGLLVTLVTFILKFVNNKKTKERALNFINVSNKLIELIIEVEKIEALKGDGKKRYVLERIDEYASRNNLQYDKEEVTKKLEEYVTLTRNVNIEINKKGGNGNEKSI